MASFFFEMSGYISSRRRQLSTKQWSGNKCSDVPTKIQTVVQVTRWIIGTARVNSGGHGLSWASSMPLHALDSTPFPNSQGLFEGLFYLNVFLFQNTSSKFHVDKTESLPTRQDDMSHFLKLLFCFVANFVNKLFCQQSQALVDDSRQH